MMNKPNICKVEIEENARMWRPNPYNSVQEQGLQMRVEAETTHIYSSSKATAEITGRLTKRLTKRGIMYKKAGNPETNYFNQFILLSQLF